MSLDMTDFAPAESMMAFLEGFACEKSVMDAVIVEVIDEALYVWFAAESDRY